MIHYGEQIRSLEGVNNIRFKTEEEALNQLKKRYGKNQDMLDAYQLPASYVVTLSDLTLSGKIVEQVNTFENVRNVTSSQDTIQKLVSLANGIRMTSVVIIVLLVLISTFIIANTIKLTVHARRKEISIMKYVGATNSFIRWPFIVEGMIIGIVAGLISILIIGMAYNALSDQILQSSLQNILSYNLLTFNDMFGALVIVYAALGVGIGVIGSSISMRKYLEV